TPLVPGPSTVVAATVGRPAERTQAPASPAIAVSSTSLTIVVLRVRRARSDVSARGIVEAVNGCPSTRARLCRPTRSWLRRRVGSPPRPSESPHRRGRASRSGPAPGGGARAPCAYAGDRREPTRDGPGREPA